MLFWSGWKRCEKKSKGRVFLSVSSRHSRWFLSAWFALDSSARLCVCEYRHETEASAL